MTMQDVLTLLGIWAVSVIAPGPDVAVVLQRSLVGRRHGLFAALGVVTANAATIPMATAVHSLRILMSPDNRHAYRTRCTSPATCDALTLAARRRRD